MLNHKFERLIKRGILTETALDECLSESVASGTCPEECLVKKGVPKHEILFCLAEFHQCPFVEYEETVIPSRMAFTRHLDFPFVEYDESGLSSYFITMRLDMEKLKRRLWFPLYVGEKRAEAIVYDPSDPLLMQDIKDTLRVEKVHFIIALPSDLVRIIEHNFDVNPNFPSSAGRTSMAKVRTFLADRRSLLTCTRTALAKGKTGLAFVRTGVAFIATATVLFRILGLGLLTVFEAALLISGVIMVVDGLLWYLPARKAGGKVYDFKGTEPTWGTTILKMSDPGDNPVFMRTESVEGAAALRSNWSNLSPVMRRRFLASDRTDFAEERTVQACYRTKMSRARIGLAFTRTGVAFAGFGIALLRQFRPGPWTFFDAALIMTGVAMAAEGFHWYVPGRRAGSISFDLVRNTQAMRSLWDFVFPPALKYPDSDYKCVPPVRQSHSPGIWATTGLALERTMLADRRNVMARLRTVMARSRTGLALVRTGIGIAAVGMELLVFFGTGNIAWTICNMLFITVGLALFIDGMYWHFPAEKIRKQYPYCYGEMELKIPDYGVPSRSWSKVVFDSDER